MQKRLNEDFIDSYCEKFASKITNDIFSEEKTKVSGKEIVSVTPSKQVNFFVIKSIFRIWQEEAQKLQSPFFDYQNDEVRKAMVQFMNTLSQHIQIEQDNFKNLVNNAVKETIYLMASPQAYVEIDLETRGVDKITDKVVETSIKYLRIHKEEIKNFLFDMKGLIIEDVIEELPEEFGDFDTTKAVEEELKNLSQVIPLSIDTVFSEDPDLDDDFDLDDLFGGDESDLFEDESEAKVTTEAPVVKENKEVLSEKEKEPKIEDKPVSEPVVEEKKEVLPPTPVEEKAPEEEIPKVEVPKQEEAEVIKPTPEPKTEEIQSDNSRPNIKVVYQEEEPESEKTSETINEQFSEKHPESLAQHHASRGGNEIMKMISLNDRYLFIRELFGNDKNDFEACLDELEDQPSFDVSVEFLMNKHAKKHGWDMQSGVVKEFLKIIYRRFR